MAWLAAGLLAYVVLLQGLVSAYAKSTMAADAFGPAFVICSIDGAVEHAGEHPLDHLAKDCCSTLCQAGCAAGPATAGSGEAVPVARELSLRAWFPQSAPRAPPGAGGLTGDARAPPSFSI